MNAPNVIQLIDEMNHAKEAKKIAFGIINSLTGLRKKKWLRSVRWCRAYKCVHVFRWWMLFHMCQCEGHETTHTAKTMRSNGQKKKPNCLFTLRKLRKSTVYANMERLIYYKFLFILWMKKLVYLNKWLCKFRKETMCIEAFICFILLKSHAIL